MRTHLYLAVLSALLCSYASPAQAGESAVTNAPPKAKVTETKNETTNKVAAIVLPVAKKQESPWDHVDYYTNYDPRKTEAEDVFLFRLLRSKDDTLAFGPMVRSRYSISASGHTQEGIFVGLCVSKKFR